LIQPRRGKLLHVPPLAQRQRLERNHVVLVLGSVAQGGRVRTRVYHAQRRGLGCGRRGGGGGGGKESGKLLVGEQERVGTWCVRVEVDDVEARKVAREEHIKRVYSAVRVYIVITLPTTEEGQPKWRGV
jgi:hypothetical protein